MSYLHVNEDSKALVNEDNGLLRQASVADTVKSLSSYPQTHIYISLSAIVATINCLSGNDALPAN